MKKNHDDSSKLGLTFEYVWRNRIVGHSVWFIYGYIMIATKLFSFCGSSKLCQSEKVQQLIFQKANQTKLIKFHFTCIIDLQLL